MYTVLLPRAPGARESRWMHLLCGPVDLSQPLAAPQASALGERVAQLEAQVAQLQTTVQQLCSELGLPMSPPGQA